MNCGRDDEVAINAAIVDVKALEHISQQTGDWQNLSEIAAPTAQLPLRLNHILGSTSVWFRSAVALAIIALVSVNFVLLIHRAMSASNTPRLCLQRTTAMQKES